jgi:hypothetical protein
MIWRVGRGVLLLALLAVLGLFVWRQCSGLRAPPPTSAALAPRPPPPPAAVRNCAPAPAFVAAAATNAASLQTAAWSVFGRPESGWEIYVPLTAREIATTCPPAAPGFAEALAGWQRRHGLTPSGIMDLASLDALRLTWILRRPFVAASAHGACPAPPPADRLVQARPNEGYEGEIIWLRPMALEAYRRLAAAARAEAPAVAADPRLLTIFSGFRDPADDARHCAEADDCGTVARARCSAHRTGLAMDFYLGAAPGFPPDSAADANRLYLSRSPAYHWLVANADRFGFVNYPFEPWHWEWTGEPP